MQCICICFYILLPQHKNSLLDSQCHLHMQIYLTRANGWASDCYEITYWSCIRQHFCSCILVHDDCVILHRRKPQAVTDMSFCGKLQIPAPFPFFPGSGLRLIVVKSRSKSLSSRRRRTEYSQTFWHVREYVSLGGINICKAAGLLQRVIVLWVQFCSGEMAMAKGEFGNFFSKFWVAQLSRHNLGKFWKYLTCKTTSMQKRSLHVKFHTFLSSWSLMHKTLKCINSIKNASALMVHSLYSSLFVSFPKFEAEQGPNRWISE